MVLVRMGREESWEGGKVLDLLKVRREGGAEGGGCE